MADVIDFGHYLVKLGYTKQETFHILANEGLLITSMASQGFSTKDICEALINQKLLKPPGLLKNGN